MASRGSLFSQTLLDITNTKLDELAKGRASFQAHHDQILSLLNGPNDDPIARLSAIVDGLKTCFGVVISDGRVVRGGTGNEHLEITLRNLDRFLAQAKYDPSVSPRILSRWQDLLLSHLENQSQKYKYASLYAQLTTEWLSAKNEPTATHQGDGDVSMDEFEHISSSQKLEAREAWEKSVFEAPNIDTDAIQRVLRDLFEATPDDVKNLPNALQALRWRTAKFEQALASPGIFNTASLQESIKSLLASDLLDDEKKDVLKDFLNNSITLKEISDVLDRRLKSVQEWSWGSEVLLEQRRQVNGSFKIYMHEDLLQAIFLQHIGLKWSVFWKSSLSQFQQSEGIWKSPGSSISSLEKMRRQYFLGPLNSNDSVASSKEGIYSEKYFLYNLPTSMSLDVSPEQGEEEAQVARSKKAKKGLMSVQMQQQYVAQIPEPVIRRRVLPKPQQALDSYDSHNNRPPTQRLSPMATKQKLLHLLSTDILIQTRLQGGITCFRTQVANLFASLPHATISTILSYLGVSQKWISFFKRFLSAPLKFMDDSSSAPPRERANGTPGSHVLSEVFSEVVLFCLDFQINQATDGEILWRLGDDLWFWSADHEICVKAWSTINNFVGLMGLEANESRTGSARMCRNPKDKYSIDPVECNGLPAGTICWGMLQLNPKSGRFEIDQEMVNEHISELSRQLKGQENSVFAWIQAWNTYAATFFTSNFGKSANCFGRSHVDNMLATHERIQRQVFSSAGGIESSMSVESKSNGSVIEYLKWAIRTRFGVENIPDGYFYFPTELGGLEVRNPFIGLLQIRDSVLGDANKLLDQFEYAEREDYQTLKVNFESGRVPQTDRHFRPNDGNTFFSFQEYIKYRESLPPYFTSNMTLLSVRNKFLEEPKQEAVETAYNGDIQTAISALDADSKGILQNWDSMEPYWKWVAQLYGPDVIESFGGLRIVDSGLLPIGMVSLFRSGRVKWQE
ncbi:uncharacterized protein TRUGW13939_09108 [Talaromyces rugulosus]|uniref:Reverse transcriptase domain-containing protein n=1 Tax=Talaromyces rugulosus TaxID=121627 RepID=A0A7H8R6G2_TALRU|nr:uncharacterized protein TRUGW13939_09108 [Talaromyces rugulosus]QKX61952.1 hypothetical protein TRUGW13939_09108 [Talaromyces rugulosus]